MAAPLVERVLPATPVASLEAYRAAGGGRGLDAALRLGPEATIDEVVAAGVRGRGGSGFPTGLKWRTVSEFASAEERATVVVNGAEGEPGTFKDRTLLRRTPYAVLEGALVAAHAVGARRVVVAVKESFRPERERLDAAIAEIAEAGWSDGIDVGVVLGPSAYLFGEETGLLEVVAGRGPFPRVAPPFRRGTEDAGSGRARSAGADLAVEGAEGPAPTLVNNVETLAHVAGILAEGAAWFRELGTEESPGTIICTISGSTARAGVAEVPMGTPLDSVIDAVGGGARDGRRLVAATSGVANPFIPAQLFDTLLTYEHMQAIGSGLGAAGFLLFDDADDMAAVAAGISRFLAVESCGQCTPCKADGLALADRLAKICTHDSGAEDLAVVEAKVQTVADGARCYLATQHEAVLKSLAEVFPKALEVHVDDTVAITEVPLIAPIVDIVDDAAVLDESQATKQPDWTHDATDSGKTPVEIHGPPSA